MFTMINDYLSWLKDNLSDEVTMSIMIAVGVALVTILIVMFFGVWKFRSKVLPSRSGGPKKPRFRKRDKVLFYGRKMLRKVRSFTRNTVGPGVYGALSSSRGKSKNKLVMKLAKSPSFRLLQSRRNSSLPQLKHKEPPQSFLDTDSSEMDESEQRLPPEVLYMLRSTRVFGHFEKPLFLELVKQMESLSVPNGEYLFKIGDADEFIYVLQSGRIHVFITEESTEYFVKEVKPGDSIHSLLSILDVLTGHPQPYKTVCAKAVEDTTVLRLPAKSFLSLFERFPESLVRIIQIIMIRLQRVTFTALHNYLGLSSQLINHKKQFDLRNLSISALIPNQQSSPSRKKGSAGSQSIQSGALGDSDSGLKQEAKRQPEGTDVDRKSSDFDAACIRARAVPKSDEFVETGSLGSRKSRKSSESSSISQRFEGRNAEILELAKKDLIAIMKLKNENALDGKMVLKTFRSGSNLVKQGDPDAQLIFVITGQLLVLQQKIDSQEKEAFLFSAQRGEIVGALAVLTGEPSFFTMRAKTDIMVVMISKNSFYEMMRVQPDIVLSVAHTTLARIAPFVRQIDFALDWMMVEAGKALFRQGDISDSIFITLTGRFRSVITLASGKKELVAEYGRGELVGIVEVLTDTERTTTIMAIRDTECAKLPAELLNLIKRKYPQIVTRLIHLLGQRILGHLQTGRSNVTPLGDHLEGVENKSNSNLATIAVFPTSKDVPLTSFTLELQNHLRTIGTVTRLTSDIIKANLGSSAFDAVHEFRLFNWLGHQEDMHRMTLYQCDYTMTKWTKHCVRQADSILIVALADKDSAVSELEKHLANIAVRAQKELILLHKEDADKPRGTIDWLNARDWCSSHHHIRCPKRIFSRKPVERILEVYDRMMQQEPDRQCDFGRLARFLTGTSIGLVLGGGGARGFAHVGMIKALIEAGVPIDIVGGTSMGAFIGALWCDETSITRVIQKAREWAHDMGSIWKKIFDLTYPVASIFSGGAFNHLIEKSLEDRQVEDLWIPYFCISTDLSASKMRVHTSGSLWRYVRASMSLSGYMPPLCDPVDGHYLLDGGYVNNLPADVMKSMGAQSIFAVDVGSQDDTNLTNYGDKLNGWWLLWKRWNPWAQPIRILDMNEIQSRLAYVGGTRQLEMIKNSDYCEYIRPPIDKYYTLQFGSFDEITEVGYHHGKTLLSGWHKGGLIHDLFREKSKEKTAKSAQHKKELGIPEMSKFTDLAELVSKIDEPKDDVTFYAPVSDDSSDLTVRHGKSMTAVDTDSDQSFDSLEEDGYEEEIIEEEEGEVEEDSHIADDESEPEVRNRNSRMKTTPLKYAGRE